jgi:predicted nucleic acid-binding protein
LIPARGAIARNARLWTLDTEDFDDIPDLEVSASGAN